MPIGLRVLQRRRAVSPDLIAAFRPLPVANISDCMSRMTAGGPRPGDNLMIHKAITMGQPGDIIVVDGGGDLTNALIGEIMVAEAIAANLGGYVINGAIRDLGAIRAGNFPVFAAGVTHRGPYKDGPGEINVPIAIDGMVIEPGDLIIGDDDGLLCVPYAEAESILKATQAKHEAEEISLAEIRSSGGPRSKPWVDATLTRLGCPVEE